MGSKPLEGGNYCEMGLTGADRDGGEVGWKRVLEVRKSTHGSDRGLLTQQKNRLEIEPEHEKKTRFMSGEKRQRKTPCEFQNQLYAPKKKRGRLRENGTTRRERRKK